MLQQSSKSIVSSSVHLNGEINVGKHIRVTVLVDLIINGRAELIRKEALVRETDPEFSLGGLNVPLAVCLAADRAMLAVNVLLISRGLKETAEEVQVCYQDDLKEAENDEQKMFAIIDFLQEVPHHFFKEIS